MHLVQFGRRYINMDQVVDIEFQPATSWSFGSGEPEGYKLYTNQIVDGTPNYIWITGGDAIALEQWLDENSEDARAPMTDDDSEAEYESRLNQQGGREI
jgi:hypothetical protein